MVKHVQKKIEIMQGFMKETATGCITKQKDLADVKTLIGVKASMEVVYKQND